MYHTLHSQRCHQTWSDPCPIIFTCHSWTLLLGSIPLVTIPLQDGSSTHLWRRLRVKDIRDINKMTSTSFNGMFLPSLTIFDIMRIYLLVLILNFGYIPSSSIISSVCWDYPRNHAYWKLMKSKSISIPGVYFIAGFVKQHVTGLNENPHSPSYQLLGLQLLWSRHPLSAYMVGIQGKHSGSGDI